MHNELGGRFDLMRERRIRIQLLGIAPATIHLLLAGEPVTHFDQPSLVTGVAGSQGDQSTAPSALTNLLGQELPLGRFHRESLVFSS